MLIMTFAVDAPAGLSLAIKEHLAMLLEQFGDTRVIDIREGRYQDGESDQTHPGGPAPY